MADNMFHDVVEPSITVGSTQRYTLPLSIGVHALIITFAVIVPLLATDVLPKPPSMLAVVMVDPVPRLPAVPRPSTPRQARQVTVNTDPRLAPIEAPSSIGVERDPEPEPTAAGTVDGIADGVPGSIAEVGSALPLPLPPPQVPVIHAGGIVSPPVKIKDIKPVYPAVARAARIEGVVIIEATIGPNGTVEAVKVLRSIPLLDDAAVDAVRQWEFTPTLLNNTPVAVVMTVTVNFKLQ